MTERARYWRRHLDRWERSRLSQAAYCRRHGLKAVTFGWWKRKFGTGAASKQSRARTRKPASWDTGGNSTSEAKFVEVEMISPGTTTYEVVLSREVVIRLPADFDPDKASQLIAVVKAAC